MKINNNTDLKNHDYDVITFVIFISINTVCIISKTRMGIKDTYILHNERENDWWSVDRNTLAPCDYKICVHCTVHIELYRILRLPILIYGVHKTKFHFHIRFLFSRLMHCWFVFFFYFYVCVQYQIF